MLSDIPLSLVDMVAGALATALGRLPGHIGKRLCHLPQHVSFDHVVGPVAPLFPSHQAGSPQDLKVLRNGGFGYPQMLGQSAHAIVMTQKEIDDLKPVGITQDFEFLFDIFHGLSKRD
jgi:hypothetical protein